MRIATEAFLVEWWPLAARSFYPKVPSEQSRAGIALTQQRQVAIFTSQLVRELYKIIQYRCSVHRYPQR